MIIKNNNSKSDNYSILTESINLTSLDIDTKSTNEIVKIFSEADKEPQKAVLLCRVKGLLGNNSSHQTSRQVERMTNMTQLPLPTIERQLGLSGKPCDFPRKPRGKPASGEAGLVVR